LGPGNGSITAAGDTISTTSNVILGSGITPLIPQMTVVRLRGTIGIQLVTATAAEAGFNYALGIGICTADAFAIGVTATPTPFDDAEWPGWLWHHFGYIKAPQEVHDLNQVPLQQITIDSKAMRKLRLNEILYAAIECGEQGTAVIRVHCMTRVLVKLP